MHANNKISKNELSFIIDQGEGQFTEFKENIDKSFAKEVVAFANSNGGKILLGVTDYGKIKGLKLSNKLKSQIIDTALNCDPKIIVSIKQLENVIVVSVEESSNKPHSCSAGFFIRVGANSQKLTRDEILKFAISQGLKSFDEEINTKFIYPQDFDDKKFNQYLTDANIENVLSREELLVNLGVAQYHKKSIIFNNTGVLFFAKSPSKFFFTSKVVCAEFAFNNKAKILDKKVYDNGILENIKQVINFVTKHIKVEFVIESAERKEIPQFPEEVYREAVVNAILHRDYSDKSSDVFIEVFRNKVIISNPGGLVKWLNKKDFGKISKTRNSIIASLLARTKYVEKMGTGITRMNNAMKKANLPKLIFDFDDYTFFTTLNDNEKNITEALQNEWGEKWGENEKKIITLISENKYISISKIAELTSLSTSGSEKIIGRLKKNGLLKRIGPAKGGYWKIIEDE
jgi:ATP-dependent DNA helicase RecG